MAMRILLRRLAAPALALALLAAPRAAAAECIELKNDTFSSASASVVAARDFCMGERISVILTSPQAVTIQKLKMLLSGDGQKIMENFTLKLEVFEESGKAVPGKSIRGEVPYSAKTGSFTGPQPFWFEISQLAIPVKAGGSVRISLVHDDAFSCELRLPPGTPLCARECGWWSVTTDLGPLEPKRNLVAVRPVKCKELPAADSLKWKYAEELPAGCRQKGNFIIRAMAYTGSGKACAQTGPGGDPVVAGVVPNSGSSDSDTPVTISGSNFAAPAVVLLRLGSSSTALQKVQVKSANSIGGTVPRGLPAGLYTVVVQSGGKEGTLPGAFKVVDGGTAPGSPVPQTITPAEGPAGKKTPVAILGQGFTTGVTFKLGATALESVEQKSPTSATAIVPGTLAAGEYDLVATDPDGKSGVLTKAFKVLAGSTPSVAKVVPTSGSSAEPVDVVVMGDGFLDGAQVLLGQIQLNQVKVSGPKTITAVVPSGVKADKYDITVVNPGGQRGTLPGGYVVVEAGGCGCGVGGGGPAGTEQGMALMSVLVVLMLAFRRRKGGRTR